MSDEYFCHLCDDRTVPIVLDDGSLKCPRCDGDFVELVEEEEEEAEEEGEANAHIAPQQQQTQQQQQQQQHQQQPIGQILGQNLANLFLPPNVHFSFSNNGFQISSQSVSADGSQQQQQQQQQQQHPLGQIFPMFQQIMQQFRRPAHGLNMGDFVPEEHMSHLLHQLMMRNPGQQGTPPTSQSVIESLPVNKWAATHKEEEKVTDCAVCQDEFVLDDTFIRLPCQHIYHQDCIVPWLKMHSSCPVCRASLNS